MADICGDNRFEIIKKAKAELLESTNIETSEDEMKVLDNFLFRCGQMGWLERYDKPREPLDIPTMTTDFVKEHGLPCPEEYVFKDENGNVINATRIVLEKKNIIREEQIDNAAQEYIDSDNAVLTYSDGFCEQTDHPFFRAAFKAGVEWADNNVTQDDCSKAPKLTSQDYSNGRFGYRLPAGFEAKLTERELILTPEKPKYPKTYEECCKVIGYALEGETIIGYKTPLLRSLQKLIICRDAYWKIAGEEMGLGEPWVPDWNTSEPKYVIACTSNEIEKQWETTYCKVLAFPTAEMQDAFYENFKKEIEQCKELL